MSTLQRKVLELDQESFGKRDFSQQAAGYAEEQTALVNLFEAYRAVGDIGAVAFRSERAVSGQPQPYRADRFGREGAPSPSVPVM
ncbi:hypothetical protein [Aquamicrobium soli]|uniref:Uncharacterized protein n=1 Tax=Aquamicrobium soli TaxID=1811518 RepID=A0ABV7KJY5_9HYPH